MGYNYINENYCIHHMKPMDLLRYSFYILFLITISYFITALFIGVFNGSALPTLSETLLVFACVAFFLYIYIPDMKARRARRAETGSKGRVSLFRV